MDKNRIKLPKDSLVEPEELRQDGDVEGHGLPLTAPPSVGPQRTPSHGGEIAMPATDDDDVEGPHGR